ncbi:hypothetical protein CC85DRAFT_286121 [Cutaneotrichosporon oleaginosum]|uniref:SET domain-containing protein n=1 Tax=Cutaneotrichosporon oleaginosum TaxID=879819 RepID=A0A0J0XL55_9TREE|nr:uncharacterized protein CC85DRAFT_286121 [Cutaneotrichosporon oleaginosum]KLT41878.1 hypothetical protein CC85DRAFT_286121 [Cutaneotrichosporon oleaginosum]
MARLGNDSPAVEPDAGPAEDLSGDDDLLNHILVNTIAQNSPKGIGLHPQTVGYVGPTVAYDEVLDILQRHVIETGNIAAASDEFLVWGPIKDHLETRTTNVRKGRFIKHLRRYLMIYGPTSRVEIFKTDRYKEVTLHDELGVYATRNLEEGAIVDELQGSVVKFPKSWEADLERGRFRDGAADDLEEDEDEEGSEDEEDDDGTRKRNRKPSAPQRRSERTGRRDFSVLRSSLKNCLQLFLGPARFLNHDCDNNVELYRKEGYVTFKVLRPIKIGQELTTFYGPDYFGRANRECMCLTCEISGSGYYKDNPSKRTLAEAAKRAASEGATSRRAADSDDEAADTPLSTPRKTRRHPGSAMDSMAASEDEENEEPERRCQPKRRAVLKAKKIDWGLGIPGRRRQAYQEETETQAGDSDSDASGDATDAGRCLTCAAKTKSLWVRNQEFLLCQRCCRHAMIFLLPWPAHRKADVREYPPPHLLPRKYYPPQKVSQVELPTYLPKPRALQRVEQTAAAAAAAATAQAKALLRAASSEIPDTKEHRLARHRATETARNEFDFEMAARSAWDKEDARREALASVAKARERAKAQRAESRRKMDEGKQKGVGLWSRYTTETHEQREERERKRFQFVTGTRSGRKIRAPSEGEAEVERLAREALLKERERELLQSEKQREWRERDKSRRVKASGRASDSEVDSNDDLAELDDLDDLDELNELGANVAQIEAANVAQIEATTTAVEAEFPEPDPGIIQDKLLLAGGEEGEEDEDAENEALGREAGTAQNPYYIDDDDDDDDSPILLSDPPSSVKNETSRKSPQQRRRRRSSRPVEDDSDSDSSVRPGASRLVTYRSLHTPLQNLSRAPPHDVSATRDSDSSSADGNSPQKAITIEDSDDEDWPVRPPRQSRPLMSSQHRRNGHHSLPLRGTLGDTLRAPASGLEGAPATSVVLAALSEPAEPAPRSYYTALQHKQHGGTLRHERHKQVTSSSSAARQYGLTRNGALAPSGNQLPRRDLSEMSIDEASPQDGVSADDDHEARSAEGVERVVESSSRSNCDDSASGPSNGHKHHAPLSNNPPSITPAKRSQKHDRLSNESHKPRKKSRTFFRVQQELKLPRVPPTLPTPMTWSGRDGFPF